MLPNPKREEEMLGFAKAEDYTKHMYRRWKSGDVYAPHDLSAAEQNKWKRGRMTPQTDAFDVLGINPINEYKVRRCGE
jgi:small subunit ribosomal protein S18